MKSDKTRPTTFALLVVLILISIAVTGCKKSRAAANMILITLDTQRADFISAANPENAATPHIDSLARRGILFEKAYSLIPITLPSHASLFFSQPPSEVKNYNNGQIIRAKRRRPSLVQSFQKNRYVTAAFLSLGVLGPQFGLSEGFETYNADFPGNRWYLTAREINDRVFPWLEANRDGRFFLWVHYSDPHDPYAPPGIPEDFQLRIGSETVLKASLSYYEVHQVELFLESGINRLEFLMENRFGYSEGQFLGRIDKLDISTGVEGEEMPWEFSWGWFIRRSQGLYFFKNKAWIEIENRGAPRKVTLTLRGKPTAPTESMRDLYRQEVEYMDSEIGRLWDKLEELNLTDKTAIVLVGDHGEGLGEYTNDMGDPHTGHIHYLKNVYTRVPMIIAGPGIKEGKRAAQPVSLLDLAPTILDMMGFKPRPSFLGRNILSSESGETSVIYQETHKPEAFKNRFALLQFPWHLIFIPEDQAFELYNLREDPGERKDLSVSPENSRVMDPMKSLLEEFARDSLKNKTVFTIDKKTEEMLRTLGYIKQD
jgi:membrane-anchored protein YejM (alkaline phosphatase superfamily)